MLTIISGAPNQMFTKTKVGKTSPALLKNCGGVAQRPTWTKKFGRKPETPFKIHFQEKAKTMEGKAQGIMRHVR